MRYADDEAVDALVDKYITADEAIDLMLHIQQNVHGSQGETPEIIKEEPEPDPESAPKKKTYKKPFDAAEPIERLTQKRKRGCGVCGQPGHNAKTCNQGWPNVKAEKTETETPGEELSQYEALEELESMIGDEPKLSVSELELMFPSIPLYQIVAARERILKTI